MNIIRCKVNHLTNPLGFAMDTPVFSWEVTNARGTRQTAARIRVFEEAAPLLDTGFREGADSLGWALPLSLKPRTAYSWDVTVRTDAGEEETSPLQRFETGKRDEPWQAKWISCEKADRLPVFHRAIAVNGELARARLYICGLGLYEARINGQRVGDEYFTPYCNNYNAWLQVVTHDVTDLLKDGGELSVALAEGWYSGRFGFTSKPGQSGYYGNDLRLIAEVRLDYADGRSECIPTDARWTLRRGPLTFSGIYDGEHRDDTLPETAPEAVVVLDADTRLLTDRLSPPVRVQQTMKPVELIRTPSGETVLDLGQNHTGIFSLRTDEPAGTQVRLQFGEVLQDGCFYNDNYRTAKAEYRYVSGGRPVDLRPCFTFYGYRYVKVEGITDLKPEDYTALVLYSDLEEVGRIETGLPKVNRLIENARWGLMSNFLDVPTDCPQRDERMGWTGDANVFSATACLFRDTYAFYRKYLHDMATEQAALDGMVPQVVPSFGETGTACVWGDAVTVIPWTVWQATGDLSILREQFPAMKAWVDWIRRIDGTDHGWRRHFHYGDWLALDNPALRTDTVLGGTDEGFIADVAWAESAGIVADTAALLGETADEAAYRALQRQILDGVRAEFFTATGRCAIETQTALLLSLKYGLSDPDKLLSQLDRRFKQTEGKLQTGFVGSPILCNVLSEHGRHELAVNLLLNEEYPGWLYEVNLGATTIWERWNSLSPDGSVSSTGMNSFNHYAYGSIVAWMFRHLAGLQALEPGYRRAAVRPLPDARLGRVAMEHRGWKVAWTAEDDRHLRLSLTVPFGCEAELTLPFTAEEKKLLPPGEYSFFYETDRPMRKVFGLDDTLESILGDKAAREALLAVMPEAAHIPTAVRWNTLRRLLVEFVNRPDLAEPVSAALAKA